LEPVKVQAIHYRFGETVISRKSKKMTNPNRNPEFSWPEPVFATVGSDAPWSGACAGCSAE
jgi:hypothetical protein